MTGKLEIKEVATGRYQLNLIIDVELSSGLPSLTNSSHEEQDDPGRRTPVRRQHERQEQERLTLTVKEVAEMLGIGRDRVFHLLRTGQLKSIKIGKLHRIPRTELDSFIAALLAEDSRPQTSR